jgi:adenylate kinase family enzyme
MAKLSRVAIIGAMCSGKTTFGLKLSGKLGVPVYHWDQVHWGPKWSYRAPLERIALEQDILERDTWIFEGFMSADYRERLQRAELIFFCDPPSWRCALRLLWRWCRYRWVPRPEMPSGCTEHIHPRKFLELLSGRQRRDVWALLDESDLAKVRVVKTKAEFRALLNGTQ